ncbi:hydrolase, TatD family [Dictyocaulus viviparus]|uniref:Deoxyribonuclease TATDN1 n=1 Tax=Dictyocaulus viviparus TaxID=29172 RepID=A0A0D8XU40_DICVI|nr:hydrolase, TatD family [Dictyocaulus viviparus]
MIRGVSVLCRIPYNRFSTLREMVGPKDPQLLYEPKFLDTREYPEYDLLNIRIQGYDFTYLEKFQSYVDRMARRFNFKVVESYAVASQTQRAVVYKQNSTIVDDEVNLALYDRVVRIAGVAAPHLQLFILLIQTHLPIGVSVTFKQFEKSDEDYRYIPDLLLKQKQEELKSLDNPTIKSFHLMLSTTITQTSLKTVQRLVPYELIDIGANLGHPSYKQDLGDVLNRARQAGVSKLIITGTTEKISEESMVLAETMPDFLYFTAGIHPHDAKDFSDNSINTLKSLQNHCQCVAVGECGLDFNRNFSPQDVQKYVFKKQVVQLPTHIFRVELACELKKPLFIHEREAHQDMVNILSEVGDRLPPAVVHCFTGTEEEAKKYIEMGLYIGLTGFLWKDRLQNGVQAALKNATIPLDRILIETDAPFMYPKINDKKLPVSVKEAFSEPTKQLHKFASFNRNEPCALAAVCEMIAAFIKIDPTEVAEITTANAKRVFGLN